MSIETAIGGVVSRLSDAQIESLAAVCTPLAQPSQAIKTTVPGAGVAAADAVTRLCTEWSSTQGLTGAGVAVALRVGLHARRIADQRRTRPVWTGPGAVGEQRLTAAVIHDLLASAQERILLVSFAAYTLPEIASDLRAAAERGATVDVVFETEEDNAGYHGPSEPFANIPGLRRWRWPKELRPEGAALHAKLLVIDGRRALIGSANLTHRALTENTEAGVMTSDPAVASELEGHISQLMKTGTLATEMRPSVQADTRRSREH